MNMQTEETQTPEETKEEQQVVKQQTQTRKGEGE